MSEMNLERPDAKSSMPATARTSNHGWVSSAEVAQGLKRRYTLWCVIAPTAIVMVAFGTFCALECTALPWLTFIYAPLIALALMAIVAIVMWLKAGQLAEDERRSVRRHILSSILWGPLAAYAGFAVTLMALQFFGLIVSIF